MEPLFFVLVFMAVAGISVLRYHGLIGYPSSYSLLPFQGGILFRRGRPIREVGPGRHRVFIGIEKILFLDKRPIQVNVENRAVALTDGGTAFYGFSASAQVCDVKKATYAAANYIQIPGFVTLCVTRAVLNRSQSTQLGLGRKAVEEEIVGGCRSRLLAAGFELVSFRFTTLQSTAPALDAN
jgi:hypothetical protein